MWAAGALIATVFLAGGCSSSTGSDTETSARVTVLSIRTEDNECTVRVNVKNTGTTTILMTEMEFLVEFTDGSKRIEQFTTFWLEPGDSLEGSFSFDTGGKSVRDVSLLSKVVTPW